MTPRIRNAGLVSLRFVVIVFVLLGGWWWAGHRGRTAGRGNAILGPLPPQVSAGDEPLQTGVSSGTQPLCSRRSRWGAEAAVSPTDLALGWQRMSETPVLSQLKIKQSSRWYHCRWNQEPPLPPTEIARSSANMRTIPPRDTVAKTLARIGKVDRVRLDGWLVDTELPDGRWTSSATRDDTGAHACELAYVCSVTLR